MILNEALLASMSIIIHGFYIVRDVMEIRILKTK
jgi:hypothetical protein